MNRIYKIVTIVAAALLLGFLSFKAGEWRGVKHAPIDIVERHDTLRIVDTVSVDKPVYISRRVVDTMFVAVLDTLRLRDTLYLQLPREEKVYTDSLYRAVVSGYEPSLDRIDIYRKTIEYYTNETKYEYYPVRWGISVSTGYGVGKGGLTPYIGVGLSYTILPLGWR